MCTYLFYIYLCDFFCDCFVTVVPWPSMTFHHILFCGCFVIAIYLYFVLSHSIVFVIDDIAIYLYFVLSHSIIFVINDIAIYLYFVLPHSIVFVIHPIYRTSPHLFSNTIPLSPWITSNIHVHVCRSGVLSESLA